MVPALGYPPYPPSTIYCTALCDLAVHHGTSGPLPVSELDWETGPLVDAWIKAGKQLGYDYVDYNGARQTGK